VTTERDSLEMHVDICALRYAGIQDKMETIDKRFDRIEADIKEIKEASQENFDEIKRILIAAKDEKFKTMITVAGSVIGSILALLGFVLFHFK
jgi:predicted  nucleic acid-binding Zn-ribbon protein